MADEVGFELFVRTHAVELLRSAVLLTGNLDHGEELLQDSLTHLYPRWDKVAGADAPVAYVRRVLVNRFVSAARSSQRRVVPVWDVPDQAAGLDLGEDVATRRHIWQLIGRLPERQRAAVVLRYFHDQTDTQIAGVLGCRAVTVRSLLSRAVAAMRADLRAGEIIDKAGSW